MAWERIGLLAALVLAGACGAACGGEPARPVVVEMVAACPGLSVEEVERQVAIPLEVMLAGLPRLRAVYSESVFGMCQVATHLEDGSDPFRAREEVIRRLKRLKVLPPGVEPLFLPASAGALVRYTLRSPKDDRGRDIYTADDLRALQDWTLERELRRVPRVADVIGSGGSLKRYEVRIDPDRLRRYGVTLAQVETALLQNKGGLDGKAVPIVPTVREIAALGLLGGGKDPLEQARAQQSPREAARLLRAEEERRLGEIRTLVVTRVANVPVRVEDLVEGGRQREGESGRGVLVGRQARRGRVGLSRGRQVNEDDVVQGVVLLRAGEDGRAALRDVRARIQELNNTPGKLLPGVRLEVHDEDPEPGSPTSAASKRRLWLDAALPANVSWEEASAVVRKARTLLARHEEVETVVSEVGSPKGLALAGIDRPQLLVRLGPGAPRGLPGELRKELHRTLPGVSWSFAPESRDDLLEAFVPAASEVLVTITGPDLAELERLAEATRLAAARLEGVQTARVLHLRGAVDVTPRPDASRCKRWGVAPANVERILQAAGAGLHVTTMVEGERQLDITLRWSLAPAANALRDLPVDVPGPRVRLGDLVALSKDEQRTGATAIYRENGRRLIAVRLRVEEGAAARVVREGRKHTASRIREPYRVEWRRP